MVISLPDVLYHLLKSLWSFLQSVMLQTQGDADRDRLHAVVGDCTELQLLLDVERQMGQSVERFITDLQRLTSHHSNLVDSVGVSLHSEYVMHMRRVCHRLCTKRPSAFATVLPYTSLTLIQNLERMSALHNRVCPIFW